MTTWETHRNQSLARRRIASPFLDVYGDATANDWVTSGAPSIVSLGQDRVLIAHLCGSYGPEFEGNGLPGRAQFYVVSTSEFSVLSSDYSLLGTPAPDDYENTEQGFSRMLMAGDGETFVFVGGSSSPLERTELVAARVAGDSVSVLWHTSVPTVESGKSNYSWSGYYQTLHLTASGDVCLFEHTINEALTETYVTVRVYSLDDGSFIRRHDSARPSRRVPKCEAVLREEDRIVEIYTEDETWPGDEANEQRIYRISDGALLGTYPLSFSAPMTQGEFLTRMAYAFNYSHGDGTQGYNAEAQEWCCHAFGELNPSSYSEMLGWLVYANWDGTRLTFTGSAPVGEAGGVGEFQGTGALSPLPTSDVRRYWTNYEFPTHFADDSEAEGTVLWDAYRKSWVLLTDADSDGLWVWSEQPTSVSSWTGAPTAYSVGDSVRQALIPPDIQEDFGGPSGISGPLMQKGVVQSNGVVSAFIGFISDQPYYPLMVALLPFGSTPPLRQSQRDDIRQGQRTSRQLTVRQVGYL